MMDKTDRGTRETVQTVAATAAVVGAVTGAVGVAAEPAVFDLRPEARKVGATTDRTPLHDCDRLAADPHELNTL